MPCGKVLIARHQRIDHGFSALRFDRKKNTFGRSQEPYHQRKDQHMVDITNSLPREDRAPLPAAAEENDEHWPERPHAALTQDQLSLEAVINVLVQKGLCTEAELLQEEARLRAVRSTLAGLQFTPVQTMRKGESPSHDHHVLRKWASRYRWSRKLGARLFGWKWKKMKRYPS